MRIDSGLQGYYYDQGKFQKPDAEAEEAAPAQAAAPVRHSAFSLGVESSTLLSSSLSNALWALEGGRKNAASVGLAYAGTAENEAEELAAGVTERVNALYLENSQFADEDRLYA